MNKVISLGLLISISFLGILFVGSGTGYTAEEKSEE